MNLYTYYYVIIKAVFILLHVINGHYKSTLYNFDISIQIYTIVHDSVV